MYATAARRFCQPGGMEERECEGVSHHAGVEVQGSADVKCNAGVQKPSMTLIGPFTSMYKHRDYVRFRLACACKSYFSKKESRSAAYMFHRCTLKPMGREGYPRNKLRGSESRPWVQSYKSPFLSWDMVM